MTFSRNSSLIKCYRSFFGICRYIYSEEISGLAMDNAMEVVHCEKKYAVTRLVNQARTFVQDSLTSDNVCFILSKVSR